MLHLLFSLILLVFLLLILLCVLTVLCNLLSFRYFLEISLKFSSLELERNYYTLISVWLIHSYRMYYCSVIYDMIFKYCIINL